MTLRPQVTCTPAGSVTTEAAQPVVAPVPRRTVTASGWATSGAAGCCGSAAVPFAASAGGASGVGTVAGAGGAWAAGAAGDGAGRVARGGRHSPRARAEGCSAANGEPDPDAQCDRGGQHQPGRHPSPGRWQSGDQHGGNHRARPRCRSGSLAPWWRALPTLRLARGRRPSMQAREPGATRARRSRAEARAPAREESLPGSLRPGWPLPCRCPSRTACSRRTRPGLPDRDR